MHELVRKYHEQNNYMLDGEIKQTELPDLAMMSRELRNLSKQYEALGLREQERGDPRYYRVHLLLEELGELVGAIATGDEVKLADGGADLAYVVIGTLESYGIPFDHVFKEVAQSNLTKRKRNGMDRVRDKGANYVPPNIMAAIIRGRDFRRWNKELHT